MKNRKKKTTDKVKKIKIKPKKNNSSGLLTEKSDSPLSRWLKESGFSPNL